MNFFEHQRRARQNSLYLLIAFLTAMILVSAATAMFLHSMVPLMQKKSSVIAWPIFDLMFFVKSKIFWGTFLFIGVCSVFRSLNMGNGAQIATSMGGQLVSSEETDTKRRQLLNVVEEMSLAANMTTPLVFVFPDVGINAFAAGFDLNSAAIGISQGALDELKRDELQAIVGHEMSHILNGDMKTNMDIAGAIFGLMVIYRIGEMIMRGTDRRGFGSSRSKSDSGRLFLLGLGFFIIGAFGAAVGRILQGLLSQQREFLADASSTQFTRDPESLGRALAKASRTQVLNRFKEARLDMSHLFFTQVGVGFFGNLMATHPPISERIQRLLPNWNAQQIEGLMFDAPKPRTTEDSSRAKEKSTAAMNHLQAAMLLKQVERGSIPVFKTQAKAPAEVLRPFEGWDLEQIVQKIDEMYLQRGSVKTPELFSSVQQRLDFLTFALGRIKTLPWEKRRELIANWVSKSTEDGKLDYLEYVLLLLSNEILMADQRRSLIRGFPLRLDQIHQAAGALIYLVAAVDSSGQANTEVLRDSLLQKASEQLGIAKSYFKATRFLELSQALKSLQKTSVPYRQNLVSVLWNCVNNHEVKDAWDVEMVRALCILLNVPPPIAVQQAAQ